MSQTNRVRDQLRIGPITILDFDRQPAIDGGNRVTRLARCIGDLKARGYEIDSKLVAVGDVHVALYTLVAEPEADRPADTDALQERALSAAQQRLRAAVPTRVAPVADAGEQGALFDLPDVGARRHFEEAA